MADEKQEELNKEELEQVAGGMPIPNKGKTVTFGIRPKDGIYTDKVEKMIQDTPTDAFL